MSNSLRKFREEQLENELKELEQAEKRNKEQEEENKKNDTPVTDNAEEETFRKRYADARRYIERLKQENKEELDKLREQLDEVSRSQMKLPKTKEEVKEWAENYPDVAGIIKTIVLEETQQVREENKKEYERIKKLEEDLRNKEALTILLSAHPDFPEIRKQQDFHDWLSTKSKAIRDIMYTDGADPYDAVDVVTMYKELRGIKDKKKKNTDDDDFKSAANGVKTRGRSTPDDGGGKNYFSESDVAKMSEREYLRHAEEIEKQMANGTFIYDLSRKA